MTGWNLPPGCSVRDIPGNRPGDDAAESFTEEFYAIADKCEGQSLERHLEALSDWAWGQICRAYTNGYKDGQADEAMAQAHKEGTQ